MNDTINRVLITGGGIVAWWASVFLKKNMPELHVVVVDTGDDAECADVASADLLFLLHYIGINEQQLILHADGNIHGARAFFEWHDSGGSCFFSDEINNVACGIVDFNQWLLKLKCSGFAVVPEDYLLSAALAKQGKIPAFEDFRRYAIGCSFDVKALHRLLKAYAVSLKVEIVQEEIKAINITTQGFIGSITTQQDKTLAADFYIDATGDSALLMNAIPANSFESWDNFFPCNRRKILVSAPRSERLIPFSSIQMGRRGWVKNTPLRTKVVSEFIYPQALDNHQFFDDVMVRTFKNCEELKHTTGYRQKSWVNNCLALGRSAIAIDRLSHSELFLAAISLKRFFEYWPAQTSIDVLSNEFNRLMKIEFEALRDFHCLHYFLVHKNRSAFSNVVANLSVPETLMHRIHLFKESGRCVADEATVIHPQHWIQLFLGFSYWPDTYDAIANTEPPGTYERWGQDISAKNAKKIMELPEYTQYMKAYFRFHLNQ